MKKFDYKKYVEKQTKINKSKLRVNPNIHWVKEEEIKEISKYIEGTIPEASFGICHGVRNGWEVEKFRDVLQIEIIGTDISDSAINFSNVIHHDFHKVKDEWINNVDFIYSNSLDHSYDENFCIDQWMKCIKQNGLCFIQWTISHANRNSKSNHFNGTKEEYRKLFERKYKVVDIIELKNAKKKPSIFVIKH